MWNRLHPPSCPNSRRVCIKRDYSHGRIQYTNAMPRQVGVRPTSLFLSVTPHRFMVALCKKTSQYYYIVYVKLMDNYNVNIV